MKEFHEDGFKPIKILELIERDLEMARIILFFETIDCDARNNDTNIYQLLGIHKFVTTGRKTLI